MHPPDRRAQLLDAARKVFAERGYHRAGVSHIIREAGVARGTFYNYFDSKRAVFQQVLDSITEDLVTVVQPIDLGQPVGAQVHANIVRMVSSVMRPEVPRLLFSEAVGIDAEGDAELRRFYNRAEARLAGSLAQGQAAGIVRPGNPQLMARCMIGMVKEPVFLAALRDEPLDPDEFVTEFLATLSGGMLQVELS
jgi:AcrR family transcriptional regulator